MVAEHHTRRSRALADALATGLLLAAVAAGGLSFAGTASAGVAALGSAAAEPSGTPRPASDRRLLDLRHGPAREVPVQPPPPGHGPEPSAPAGGPVTSTPDPATPPSAHQSSTPTSAPSHRKPARSTPAHPKPARATPKHHEAAPSHESDRPDGGPSGPAVAAQAQVAGGDSTAVRKLSGVAAEAPDTRGLDERFPSSVPSATPATATRLSAGEPQGRPEGYERSLVVSGLLGLGIAVFGLTMVTRRRRTW
jgi:hypothetical protein